MTDHDHTTSTPEHAIAIVGIAGRFPGAPDLASYWDVLRTGRVCVRVFDREALREAGVPDAVAGAPGYVPARAILDDADCFDAQLFGMTPAEAELMDPQFRQFLECSQAALEDAAIVSGRGQRIGVFGGVGAGAYMLHLLRDPSLGDPLALFRALIHNEKDYLTTFASYKLDLRGPAVTVQSACSTALVAVHLACQSLLSGECDAALAGGSSISFPQNAGYRYETGGFLSPDGLCRPFDADGRGTVEGNGVGVAVLRRLEDALADGDPIRAVILGSAVNNDGAGRVGFTAPGVDGQIRVLAEALAMAGVDPHEVDFIETHGTGTQLGDPIEVAALGRVYGSRSRSPALLGAVKANIGHLGPAAGIAGLCKVVLALQHAEIPPTPHFRRANPVADLAAGPFEVPTAPTAWPERAHRRRAAISAFGIGGTNAHLVLEEAPPLPPPAATGPCALVWSALDDARADEATGRLADHLERHPELALGDVAFTLQTGRRAYRHRRALVVAPDDALAQLRDPRRIRRGVAGERPRVAFLFAGLGDQYPGMARALDRDEPVFSGALDRCARGFSDHLGIDLRAALYPPDEPARAPALDLRRMLGRAPEPDTAPALRNTRLAQAAVFGVGYALAQLMIHRGVAPDAVIGHSLGEYLAAHVAGVMTLDEAIALVAARARLLGDLAPGAMLTVALGEAEVARYLEPGVSLSAVNAPEACTLAGEPAAIERVHGRLREAGVAARPLPADRAFHSWMMDPAVPETVRLAGRMALRAPRIPCISNVTGEWLTAGEAVDPAYWGRHLRLPVRFAAGAATLCAGQPPLLVEIGAGQALGSFVRQAGLPTAGVVATLKAHYEHDDGRQALEAVTAAWLAGVDVAWPSLHLAGRRRVSLPAYPFAKTRHIRHVEPGASWPPGPAPAARPADQLAGPLPGTVTDAAPGSVAGAPRPAARAAPTNPVEEELVRIWRELLRVPELGIDDNFFELGGQSLVGVQLLSRIQQTWGVELPLRALFSGPTIAQLALAIEEALVAEIEGEAIEDHQPPDPP
jgi:phthiocerol/phenolphthiocerol synthesis type-I polyketide synthase E